MNKESLIPPWNKKWFVVSLLNGCQYISHDEKKPQGDNIKDAIEESSFKEAKETILSSLRDRLWETKESIKIMLAETELDHLGGYEGRIHQLSEKFKTTPMEMSEEEQCWFEDGGTNISLLDRKLKKLRMAWYIKSIKADNDEGLLEWHREALNTADNVRHENPSNPNAWNDCYYKGWAGATIEKEIKKRKLKPLDR